MTEVHDKLADIITDAVQGEDSRKHRRVLLPAPVRYRLPDGSEQPGRIMNISAGGAFIRARPGTAVADHLILYIHKLGRFEADVVRIERNGFAVTFTSKKKRLKRTADTLIWLINGGDRELNRRGAARIRQDKPATLILSDGSQKPCRVIDISVTGASVGIDPKPPVGESITLGRMRGTVVRHHDEGVGVEFAKNNLV